MRCYVGAHRIGSDVHATTSCNEFGDTHDECNLNKVLHDCIPEITMSFLDNILMKGCTLEEKAENTDDWGCWKFVVDDIRDCGRVLWKF